MAHKSHILPPVENVLSPASQWRDAELPIAKPSLGYIHHVLIPNSTLEISHRDTGVYVQMCRDVFGSMVDADDRGLAS
jgi:hypothetical protein